MNSFLSAAYESILCVIHSGPKIERKREIELLVKKVSRMVLSPSCTCSQHHSIVIWKSLTTRRNIHLANNKAKSNHRSINHFHIATDFLLLLSSVFCVCRWLIVIDCIDKPCCGLFGDYVKLVDGCSDIHNYTYSTQHTVSNELRHETIPHYTVHWLLLRHYLLRYQQQIATWNNDNNSSGNSV